jgi:hypothetical protein
MERNGYKYKYGLSYRLIDEKDASFIVKLRTDKGLSQYLPPIENDIDKQINWIREYKERERNKTEFYFIYYFEDKPIGLNRIYNIKEKTFTFGSWVFMPNHPIYLSIASAVIARDFAFNELNLKIELEIGGTHEKNKGVLDFSKLLGMVYDDFFLIENMGKYLTGKLLKEDYEKNKIKILRFIPKELLQC